MKRLLILISALALILCSCGSSDKTPPTLDVAHIVHHSQNEKFDIRKYCTVKDNVDKEIELGFKGKIDVATLGEYPITVIAKDKSGNKTSKNITVLVQKNRKKYSNDTICKNVRDYIFGLQNGGYPNIAFKGYSSDIGFFSEAYSVNDKFKYKKFDGTMSFEAIQYEDYKASSFNMVFFIQSDAMWYWPTKVEFTGGDEKVQVEVRDTAENDGMYGFYVTIDELSEKKSELTPDYEYVEKLKAIANSKKPVTMKAIGETDSLEIELNADQQKNFKDILMVYEELLSYY